MGILLILIGYLIRYIAINQVNNKCFWRISQPNKLVTTGIYRYTRNPMYLGSILILSGLTLWLISWQAMVCFDYAMIHYFMDRIDREEQMLSIVFEKEYKEYTLATKRFIPFLF